MKTLYQTLPTALAISLLLVGALEARTVYLKDGATLKAEAAWRANGKVIVVLNPESELTFPEGEVNLLLSFPQHAVQKKGPPRETAPGQIPASQPVDSAKKVRVVPATAAPPAVPLPAATPPPAAAPRPTPPAATSSPAKHPLPPRGETPHD